MNKKYVLLPLVAIVFLLAACSGSAKPQQATGGARQVINLGFTVPKNAQGNTTEQQNIIDRLKVTSDPTKVMWIHLISLDGKIIERMPVAHKVTSSGKRLEPITAGSSNEYGANYPKILGADGNTYETIEFMQIDGTWGTSDSYIFWFDPLHRYFQWGTAGGLGYLLTDFPIDLTNPQDLVTSMYNADNVAYQWQQNQETAMRAQATKDCQAEGLTFDSETGGCK